MEEFTLGWQITKTKFAGASAAYQKSAETYAHTWCVLNGVTPGELHIETLVYPNHVVLATTIIGQRTGTPIVPQETSEPPAQPPEIQTPEPTDATYMWVYVRELLEGDNIRSGTANLGTVASVEYDDSSGRYVLYLQEVDTPLIYGKADRVRKQV
jgi:hypothetical protein